MLSIRVATLDLSQLAREAYQLHGFIGLALSLNGKSSWNRT